MSTRTREERSIPVVQAPSKFCPRKLRNDGGPCVKRYMSTGPLAGYIIACPSCGFTEMHMDEAMGFVEVDELLVSAAKSSRCMVCGLYVHVRDGVLSAERAA